MNLENVEFKNDKFFLSNMYPCDIYIDGIRYSSAENFYMSMKFGGVNDTISYELRNCPPKMSKIIANKNKNLIRDDWHDIKVSVMKIAVTAKFTQNTDILLKLFSTEEDYLEERNDWYDTFWGTYKGNGKNMLGKILMEVRDNLKLGNKLYKENI